MPLLAQVQVVANSNPNQSELHKSYDSIFHNLCIYLLSLKNLYNILYDFDGSNTLHTTASLASYIQYLLDLLEECLKEIQMHFLAMTIQSTLPLL